MLLHFPQWVNDFFPINDDDDDDDDENDHAMHANTSSFLMNRKRSLRLGNLCTWKCINTVPYLWSMYSFIAILIKAEGWIFSFYSTSPHLPLRPLHWKDCSFLTSSFSITSISVRYSKYVIMCKLVVTMYKPVHSPHTPSKSYWSPSCSLIVLSRPLLCHSARCLERMRWVQSGRVWGSVS